MKFTLVLLVCMFLSCRQIVFHPNEVRPRYTGLNAKNMERISQLPPQASFKFILTGDTQRFYDELDDFVSHVNSLDNISFVLLNGDIADFGLNREYNWIGRALENLKAPFVATIGNHDLLANGPTIFREMFGPADFSFYYQNNKFIGLNTNSRETGFDGSIPDMNWLKDELEADDKVENIFVFSHIPPFSENFDPELELPYAHLLASQPKTKMSLHGHEHQFKMLNPYGSEVTYVVAGSKRERSYVLITIAGGSYSIEEKKY